MSSGVALVGDWEKAFKLLREAPRRIEKALQQQVLKEAHMLREQMIGGIDAGGKPKFKGHSPLSLVIRQFRGMGGSKVLIASGALRNSIVVVPVRPGVAFVGVRRRSKGKANLAHIHEFGRTWTMPFTDRMRRFLFAAMRSAGIQRRRSPRGAHGTGTITIRIPARPFIRPVVENIQMDAMRARFAAAIQAALRA